MTFYRRCLASLSAGLLSLFVARALGVPFWSHGMDLSAIGDQADFFAVAFLLVWSLTAQQVDDE